MIKNVKIWEEFEKNLVRSEKPDFINNLKIFGSMLEHAKLMKAIPLKKPLEGLEIKIKVSKIMQGLK